MALLRRVYYALTGETEASKLLVDATRRGDVEAVRMLLQSGDVDVNARVSNATALYWAAESRNMESAEIVKALIDACADVNAVTSDGSTPLRGAAGRGRVHVVKLLLAAGADPTISDKVGCTPLHFATTAAIARYLLNAGAHIHARNKVGETPLHCACTWGYRDIEGELLDSGADVNAEDTNGSRPLHSLLKAIWKSGFSVIPLDTLRLLISNGAQWDSKCDAMVEDEELVATQLTTVLRWERAAPAIRVCALRWMEEHQRGVPLTVVPVEVINSGHETTATYIAEITASTEIVYRRKICVVGPSSWGKTSFTKSITSNMPSLVHIDARTVGIDHFKLTFEERLPEFMAIKKHEVTFWDFAGQDAYQAAHSLFFSARTMYLVFVDLKAFLVACMQAELMTDVEAQADNWMDEFIDTKVLRWIRLILARQPDAEFVFVATKSDSIELQDLADVVAALRRRLQGIQVDIQAMKDVYSQKEAGSKGQLDFIPRIAKLRAENIHALGDGSSVQLMVSTCKDQASVDRIKMDMLRVIISSDKGFPMPDKFSRVLSALLLMRSAATEKSTDVRIHDTFVDVEELIQRLQAELNGPYDDEDGEIYLDKPTCRRILQTLRDLGDVLWYQDIGDRQLENTIIIDPLLLIDFVRQVVDHKHTAETMPHATLKGLPFWVHLDQDSMLSTKRMLQHFHLVLPTQGEMAWDSDLLVPGYWKSNTSAFWMFGGGNLRLTPGIQPEDMAVRVHWEVHFVNSLPDTLFDQLVIASYSPTIHRDVGPDWIMYQEGQDWACRVVIGRDLNSHERTLNLEAVVAHDAARVADQEELWDVFELVCESLALVLRGYPGLVVTSCARDDQGGKPSLRSLTKLSHRCQRWLPPEAHHIKCRDWLTNP